MDTNTTSANKKSPDIKWGKNCKVWKLFEGQNFTILQEKMPPATEDSMHFHANSEQFIFILDGELFIEFKDKKVKLGPQEGIAIPLKKAHRVINSSDRETNFLLISTNGHRQDRIDI